MGSSDWRNSIDNCTDMQLEKLNYFFWEEMVARPYTTSSIGVECLRGSTQLQISHLVREKVDEWVVQAVGLPS